MKISVEILEGLYEQLGEMVGQSCAVNDCKHFADYIYWHFISSACVIENLKNKLPELDENNYLEENINYRF